LIDDEVTTSIIEKLRFPIGHIAGDNQKHTTQKEQERDERKHVFEVMIRK